MANEQNPKRNHLLSVLPEAEWARLFPHLVSIDMPLGQVVYESGDRLNHVYFPTTAIVSLLYVMEDGFFRRDCDRRERRASPTSHQRY